MCISSETLAPLIPKLEPAFGISKNTATLATSIGMLPYLPFFFVSVYVYNNYDSKVGYGFATLLCFVGGWIRQLTEFTNDNFTWIIVG